ncbi:MAG: hypothetical protein J1E77_04555, partial [Prevotella sp.]|nr:hypothetical protein [Prevotella sp.]
TRQARYVFRILPAVAILGNHRRKSRTFAPQSDTKSGPDSVNDCHQQNQKQQLFKNNRREKDYD